MDRPRVETAAADAACALLIYQTGTDQNLYVAGDGLQRNIEMRGDLRDEQIVTIEPVEDFAPHRVRERGKYQVQCLLLVMGR